MRGALHIAEDAAQLAVMAADFILAHMAMEPGAGTFRLALAGGETPRRLYTVLATERRLNWGRLALYWGDERMVPPEHALSNQRMVRESLLAGAMRPGGVYPMPTEGLAKDCARKYGQMLQGQYGACDLQAGRPFFDLVLLGLGEDGHFASLFPGSAALKQTDWVVAVERGEGPGRLSLGMPLLENARAAMFLVQGAGKREMLRRARGGDQTIPAGAFAPEGQLHWFADRDAAGSS